MWLAMLANPQAPAQPLRGHWRGLFGGRQRFLLFGPFDISAIRQGMVERRADQPPGNFCDEIWPLISPSRTVLPVHGQEEGRCTALSDSSRNSCSATTFPSRVWRRALPQRVLMSYVQEARWQCRFRCAPHGRPMMHHRLRWGSLDLTRRGLPPRRVHASMHRYAISLIELQRCSITRGCSEQPSSHDGNRSPRVRIGRCLSCR